MIDFAALRFLVVEDHGFQRWMAGNLLQGLGATAVYTAADGQAALDILATIDPPVDIIISDLDMPGMDGMEFIRHIGERGSGVSLILMSSLDSSLVASVEGMATAYGVHLLGAIKKPATAKKIQEAVSRHTLARKPERAAVDVTAEEVATGLRMGQFEAYFQPKVDMKTRTTCGAEAIARWRHPEKGVISPKAFIASLEGSGLVDELTRCITQSAARNCRLWRSAGADMSVSVNLSLVSLADVTLADRMLQVVEGEGLEPRHLIFEVTESAATSDVGRTLENLSRLRMKGFGLSIDDYGTGYSSMSRLSRIPFTELKIDQSFVKNAAHHPSSRAMLESSLEMALKLGIVAVAEGVETQVEWDLVRQMGCHVGQGYYIARPMEARQFIDWLHMNRLAAMSDRACKS
jgi:EAL domain-containing protein (putative c-di-GMP-specific phosphodiesterase class I)/CheY-like chemotaxis protein